MFGISYNSSINVAMLKPPLTLINTMTFNNCFAAKGENHIHDFYHINYICSGEGYIRFKNSLYEFKKGQAFILPPNISHEIFTKTSYSQIGIDLSANFSDELSDQVAELCKNELKITSVFSVSASYTEMKSLLENPTELNRLTAQNLAESIIIKALKSLKDAKTSSFEKTVEGIFSRDNIWSLKLKDICDLSGYSPVHLERLMQKTYGCSAIEHLSRIKLNKICNDLENTDLSISDIAEKYGFYDAGHLTVFFKKRMGITPSKYRKQYFI